MDTNWCLTCSRPVPVRSSNARVAPYCSPRCETAAYSFSPPPAMDGKTVIPHLLRAYPATPLSPTSPVYTSRAGKNRTASFASTTSGASRDEWAHVRSNLSPLAGSISSSSSDASSASSHARPAPRSVYKPYSAPLPTHGAVPITSPSGNIHPAAASYIYQQRGVSGTTAYASFTADLRQALPPTPPKSAESARHASLLATGSHGSTSRSSIAEEEEEDEDEDETEFHGRGHDRAYFYKPSRAPPSRYAYMDNASYSEEPRETRERDRRFQPRDRVGKPSAKPIRIVGTDEIPVKRFVGGFDTDEEGGERQSQQRTVQQPVQVRGRLVPEQERGRGRERERERRR